MSGIGYEAAARANDDVDETEWHEYLSAWPKAGVQTPAWAPHGEPPATDPLFCITDTMDSRPDPRLSRLYPSRRNRGGIREKAELALVL